MVFGDVLTNAMLLISAFRFSPCPFRSPCRAWRMVGDGIGQDGAGERQKQEQTRRVRAKG
jgi:hypothetical protein